MADQNQKQVIFISAAEPSADRHCAALIRALRQTKRDLEFVGIGGPKMAQAGCTLIENPVGRAAMTYNAFAHVSRYYRLIKQVAKFLAANKPNLVIVCDSPAFNFHIAKAAKKSGIKTLFYVAPQLWAWAPWRIRKLRKCCDKLCCILPFEQDWFASRGVPAEFVGNPLLDGLTQSDLTRARRDYRGFNPANVKIAIVPGSRPAEVGTLWRPMQQIAIALHKKYPNAAFTTVAVDEATRGALDSTRLMGFRTDYSIDSVYQTTRSCDFKRQRNFTGGLRGLPDGDYVSNQSDIVASRRPMVSNNKIPVAGQHPRGKKPEDRRQGAEDRKLVLSYQSFVVSSPSSVFCHPSSGRAGVYAIFPLDRADYRNGSKPSRR